METANHEYYVSLEVAKLLKEAGFDWLTHQYYGSTAYLKRTHTAVDPDEHKASAIYWKEDAALTFTGHRNDDSLSYSAPTLDVAQRWLREVKNYYVSVDVDCDSIGVFYTVRYVFHDGDKYNASYIWEDTEMNIVKHRRIFDHFEKAQESGIKNVLEIILEKGK